MTILWSAVINGETASKSNSRKLVTRHTEDGPRPAFIKSAKARNWLECARLQVLRKRRAAPFDGDIGLDCRIFYASRRPDLDESLVMDFLQLAGIIKNDRSQARGDFR